MKSFLLSMLNVMLKNNICKPQREEFSQDNKHTQHKEHICQLR